MTTFLKDNNVRSLSYSDEFKEDFQAACESVNVNRHVGSVLDIFTSNEFQLPTKYSRGVLTSNEVVIFKRLLAKLTPNDESTIVVNSIFLKYSSITIKGRHIRSSGKQLKTPVVVMASWDDNLYGVPLHLQPNSTLLATNSCQRPVNIHYFLKVSYNCTINDVVSTNMSLFAHVSWFYPHPHCHALGKPAELWYHSLFEPFGIHSFVPVNNLSCRCAHGVKIYDDQPLLVVVPLVE